MFSECSYNVLTSGQVWAGKSIPIPGKHETSTQCWVSVVDGGPTLVQHWVDVSCLLGKIKVFQLVHQNYIYNRPFFRNCGHDPNSR